MKVELDKKALFALASDTRIEILKALQPSRRTTTQLAEELSIDKAAIHRHLKKLEEGGFVTRQEDHGFVYYGLSWKARDIISPGDNTKIIIIFSSSWLLILASVSLLVLALNSAANRAFEAYGETQMAGGNQLSEATGGLGLEVLLPAVLLVVLAVLLTYIGYSRLRRPRQRPAEKDSPDEATS